MEVSVPALTNIDIQQVLKRIPEAIFKEFYNLWQISQHDNIIIKKIIDSTGRIFDCHKSDDGIDCSGGEQYIHFRTGITQSIDGRITIYDKLAPPNGSIFINDNIINVLATQSGIFVIQKKYTCALLKKLDAANILVYSIKDQLNLYFQILKFIVLNIHEVLINVSKDSVFYKLIGDASPENIMAWYISQINKIQLKYLPIWKDPEFCIYLNDQLERNYPGGFSCNILSNGSVIEGAILFNAIFCGWETLGKH